MFTHCCAFYPKKPSSGWSHPITDDEYETVVPSHTQPENVQVVTDGSPAPGHDESSTTTAPRVIRKGVDLHSPPPLPSPECEADPAYAVVEVSRLSNAPFPPVADRVTYADPKGFQNSEVLCWLSPGV